MSAFALGIGMPVTEPRLGDPLQLEIPLSQSSIGPLPASNCVKLAPHPDDPEGESFFKEGQATIESRPGGAVLLVRSARGVTNPFVGFRVTIGCDAHISRSFMLISNPGKILPPSRSTALPGTAAPVQAAATKPVQTKSSDAPGILVISRDTTLNRMANWRYPTNRPLRDKFRTLIAQVNPGLFANGGDHVGSVPVPKDTPLNIPEGLPSWESASRVTPQEGNSLTSTPSTPSETPPTPPPQPPSKQPTSAPPPQNTNGRLIIGSGRMPALTVQEFRQTLDRLEQLMNDKTRTESDLSDTLTALISNFGEVKNYLKLMDNRLTQAETDQQRIRAEMNSLRDELQHSYNLLELLIAIIGGGATGAGLVLFFRHRLRPPSAPHDARTPPDTPPTPVTQAIPRPVHAVPKVESRQNTPQSPSTSAQRSPQKSTAGTTPTFAPPLPAASPAVPAIPATSMSVAVAAPLNTELQIPLPQNEPAPPHVKPVAPQADPAIELADLMMSLGLAHEAARALLEHIHQNAHQDPSHWFKVLEIYRKTAQRESFDKANEELHQSLNVALAPWETSEINPGSLEDYPHLIAELQAKWLKPEGETFLAHLLEDNRKGQRTGFSQPVIEDILMLINLLKIMPAMDFPPIHLDKA